MIQDGQGGWRPTKIGDLRKMLEAIPDDTEIDFQIDGERNGFPTHGDSTGCSFDCIRYYDGSRYYDRPTLVFELTRSV